MSRATSAPELTAPSLETAVDRLLANLGTMTADQRDALVVGLDHSKTLMLADDAEAQLPNVGVVEALQGVIRGVSSFMEEQP